MRFPNEVRAAKCSDRWTGLRSPVSCAKPTTSDDDTVFSNVSVIPTERSSKNSVRSGGRFTSPPAGQSVLRRRRHATCRAGAATAAARVVLVGHAVFHEFCALGAGKFLIVGAELAGCRLLLRRHREGRRTRQRRDQHCGNEQGSMHGDDSRIVMMVSYAIFVHKVPCPPCPASARSCPASRPASPARPRSWSAPNIPPRLSARAASRCWRRR